MVVGRSTSEPIPADEGRSCRQGRSIVFSSSREAICSLKWETPASVCFMDYKPVWTFILIVKMHCSTLGAICECCTDATCVAQPEVVCEIFFTSRRKSPTATSKSVGKGRKSARWASRLKRLFPNDSLVRVITTADAVLRFCILYGGEESWKKSFFFNGCSEDVCRGIVASPSLWNVYAVHSLRRLCATNGDCQWFSLKTWSRSEKTRNLSTWWQSGCSWKNALTWNVVLFRSRTSLWDRSGRLILALSGWSCQ